MDVGIAKGRGFLCRKKHPAARRELTRPTRDRGLSSALDQPWISTAEPSRGTAGGCRTPTAPANRKSSFLCPCAGDAGWTKVRPALPAPGWEERGPRGSPPKRGAPSSASALLHQDPAPRTPWNEPATRHWGGHCAAPSIASLAQPEEPPCAPPALSPSLSSLFPSSAAAENGQVVTRSRSVHTGSVPTPCPGTPPAKPGLWGRGGGLPFLPSLISLVNTAAGIRRCSGKALPGRYPPQNSALQPLPGRWKSLRGEPRERAQPRTIHQ